MKPLPAVFALLSAVGCASKPTITGYVVRGHDDSPSEIYSAGSAPIQEGDFKAPIPSATICMLDPGTRAVLHRAQSAHDGSYRLPLVKRPAILQIEAAGYEPVEQEFSTESGHFTSTPSFCGN